jgi:hypothetical protein
MKIFVEIDLISVSKQSLRCMMKFMNLSIAIFLSAIVLFIGCKTVTYTPEQQAYLDKINKLDNPFKVPLKEDKAVWSRINSFVAKYATMKIQITNEYVLQTYNSKDASSYAYDVSKSIIGDTLDISVRCMANDPFGINSSIVRRNEKILIHYAITGELPYPEFINK